MAEAQVQRFRAVLEHDPHGLGWTIARVPFDPAAVWPKMVRLRVRGEIFQQPFRTSLFRDAGSDEKRGFFLLVTRAMQRACGVSLRAEVDLALEPDMEERPAELPEELNVLLDEAEGLRTWYSCLSEYTRREIGKWIAVAKTPEARLRRGQAMAERLLSTMEAEVELPPVIERAFQARPKARTGWERLSATQRRGELFALFSYVTPEARQKRVIKLCDLAEKRTE